MDGDEVEPLEFEEVDWRGDEHLEDWPEEDAPPEYWLYKAKAEEEES
jgi:hypothetical protein